MDGWMDGSLGLGLCPGVETALLYIYVFGSSGIHLHPGVLGSAGGAGFGLSKLQFTKNMLTSFFVK